MEQSDEKFRGRNAKIRAPEFFFRGSEFLFRGSYEKIPVQKLFRGGSGAVFLSRWNFFPDMFPVSFCRRNPPAGFPAGRVSAPEVSRVLSKGQVWRGFRDILISACRVWLRFFRAVPARRPNTRISEGENEQIVNAHPEVHSVNGRMCAGGAFLAPLWNPSSCGLCVDSRLWLDFGFSAGRGRFLAGRRRVKNGCVLFQIKN